MLVFTGLVAACASSATPTTEVPLATQLPATTVLVTTTVAATTTTVTATTTTVTATTTQPETHGFGAGPLGGVLVGPGEAVQIRGIQAISDAVEPLGTDQVRGIELAIADFGSINGHQVDLGMVEDDMCNAEGGTAAAEAIVAQPEVIGVIGTTCSGAAVPASKILSQAGMVMISGSNTSPMLTSETRGTAGSAWQPGYYRVAHNDISQGLAAAQFAFGELGVARAAAIHDKDPYTEGLANAFVDSIRDLGGMATAIRCNKCDVDDIEPILMAAVAESPEVIFLPIFQFEGDLIIQTYRGVPGLENVVMIAGDGLLVDDFMAHPESAGMYFSTPDFRFEGNASVTGRDYPQFLIDYESTYGEPPQGFRQSRFHAHAYDATIMLLTAIQDTAQVQGDTLFIDRQDVRDALYAMSDFAGLTGTLACDDFGDCGAQKISIIHHLDPSDPQASRQNIVYSFAPRS